MGGAYRVVREFLRHHGGGAAPRCSACSSSPCRFASGVRPETDSGVEILMADGSLLAIADGFVVSASALVPGVNLAFVVLPRRRRA
jgi:hypothetical protein